MNFFNTQDANQFNRFNNLDSVESRIIEYIRDTDTDSANRIWKLLKYSDINALYNGNLTKEEKDSIIYKEEDQMDNRVFNFRFVEDNFTETCTLLKVYISGITPQNHITSVVDISIDILSHNKLSNVYNDDGDINEGGRPVEENVITKNRNTIILRSLFDILNGANIEGIGMLQFNSELSKNDKVEMKLSNNRNFYGYTLTISCLMSGVGAPING